VAGLDPATHVFLRCEVGSGKNVDAPVKPGQGDFFVEMPEQGWRNGTVGLRLRGNDD